MFREQPLKLPDQCVTRQSNAIVMEARRLQYKNRWFCYLDLLGFTKLVRSSEAGAVIALYEEVISKLEADAVPKKLLGISFSWFSDTFIIFSKGDSHEEFSWLEQAGRLFFQRLILANIPARGCISHGKLYTQLEKNIFIGEALIEAYEFAEDQNWIGFLLAPSVFHQLSGTPLAVGKRFNYRRVPDVGVMRYRPVDNVYAFAFNNGTVNGSNPFLTHIRSMKRGAAESVREKYENTERFIIQHSRMRAGKATGSEKPYAGQGSP